MIITQEILKNYDVSYWYAELLRNSHSSMIYGLLLVFFRPHTLQTHYNKAIVKAKLTIKLLLWISALVFFRAKMTLFNGIREKCWTKGVGKVRGRIWIYGKFMFPSDFPLLFTILSGTQIPLQRPKINFSITMISSFRTWTCELQLLFTVQKLFLPQLRWKSNQLFLQKYGKVVKV